MLALLTSLAVLAAPQVDLHLDTPTQLYRKGIPIDAPSGLEAGLPQLVEGGTHIAVEVLWPPRDVDGPAHTEQLLTILEAEIARLPELVLVRDAYEARQIADSGRIAVLISLEGAHGLGDGDWSAALDGLHSRGLSMLGLTWSFSNRFAGSVSDGGGGLTEEGRQLVARAYELGIVVDLSHASRETTLEVCQHAPVPVIASHSNAASLNPVARNLSDEEIRCIAATGGVIGVNLHAPFVGGTKDVTAVADQAERLAEVGGKAVVALGSDFDGLITPPKGLADAGDFNALWEELARRGWTEAEIAGIRGENFLRAWERVTAKVGKEGEPGE